MIQESEEEDEGVSGGRPGLDFPPDTNAESIAQALETTATSLASPPMRVEPDSADECDVGGTSDTYWPAHLMDVHGRRATVHKALDIRLGGLETHATVCLQLVSKRWFSPRGN